MSQVNLRPTTWGRFEGNFRVAKLIWGNRCYIICFSLTIVKRRVYECSEITAELILELCWTGVACVIINVQSLRSKWSQKWNVMIDDTAYTSHITVYPFFFFSRRSRLGPCSVFWTHRLPCSPPNLYISVIPRYARCVVDYHPRNAFLADVLYDEYTRATCIIYRRKKWFWGVNRNRRHYRCIQEFVPAASGYHSACIHRRASTTVASTAMRISSDFHFQSSGVTRGGAHPPRYPCLLLWICWNKWCAPPLKAFPLQLSCVSPSPMVTQGDTEPHLPRIRTPYWYFSEIIILDPFVTHRVTYCDTS
jgi:hypothetical protein